MEIVIHGRHADIKVDFKEHVIKQSSRLEKFGVKIALLDVEVTHISYGTGNDLIKLEIDETVDKYVTIE